MSGSAVRLWKVLLGWLATGLENQGVRKGRGSTPLPSAKEVEPRRPRTRLESGVGVLHVWGSSPSASARERKLARCQTRLLNGVSITGCGSIPLRSANISGRNVVRQMTIKEQLKLALDALHEIEMRRTCGLRYSIDYGQVKYYEGYDAGLQAQGDAASRTLNRIYRERDDRTSKT